jgi:hypothetical protein
MSMLDALLAAYCHHCLLLPLCSCLQLLLSFRSRLCHLHLALLLLLGDPSLQAANVSIALLFKLLELAGKGSFSIFQSCRSRALLL